MRSELNSLDRKEEWKKRKDGTGTAVQTDWIRSEFSEQGLHLITFIFLKF